MTNTPLVSVIIPNYNHARYLDQRLQTVLGQTYQKFEVIILDDCSTDNSLEVIAKYKDNPHVSQVVVNDQNSGSPFKQWDKGIHLAQGEIIWIAESDDYCELNMLEELVKAYTKKKGTVLAYCTPEWFCGDTTWETTQEGGVHRYGVKHYVCAALLNENWPLNASGCIFSKNATSKISNRYIKAEGAGDYWFWTELLVHNIAGSVVVVNKHMSKWRRHGGVVTDRLFYSGRNSLEERKIFDYVCHEIDVPSIYKTYALNYHERRFVNAKYETNDIYNIIAEAWEFGKYKLSFVEKCFRFIKNRIRNNFSYHL